MIKRWRILKTGDIDEDSNGPLVRYEDHLKALEDLRESYADDIAELANRRADER